MIGNLDDHHTNDSMDLKNFTNVPHSAAHSTRAPPPVPPPRHSKSVNTEPSAAPPAYISLDDEDNFSGSIMSKPLTSIDVDDDIREVLNQHAHEPISISDEQIPIDHYESTGKEDFYTDISKWIRQPEQDGILLPLRANLFESYASPFLMILSQIPQFSNLVLKHQYLTFSYKPNWWNREKCSENPLYVQEIQRLISFLNGNSNRAFASLYNLNFCADKIVEEEIDSVSDFHNFLTDSIVYFMTKANGSFKIPLENMFKIVGAYEIDEDERQDNLYNIPLSNDDTCQDLYQTIHNKFFQSNDESERIFLLKIPDVLPIIFEAGSNSIDGGFKLEERFYPQIYSHEHKDILLKIDEELKNLKLRQGMLNQKIVQLRAFNGKSVHRLLVDTSKHLRDESHNIGKEEQQEAENLEMDVDAKSGDNANNVISEKDKYIAASQSISMLSNNISEILKRANDEIRSIHDKGSLLHARKFDMDQLLSSEDKAQFEPWILTGVILNAVQFYYREKKANNWKGVNISEETCKSYSTSDLSFSDIKDLVRRYTEYDFGEGMVLVYVRESVFYDGEFDPLNRTLQDFVNKDNAKLKEQYDIITSNQYTVTDSSDSDILSSESEDAGLLAEKDKGDEKMESENVNPFDD